MNKQSVAAILGEYQPAEPEPDLAAMLESADGIAFAYGTEARVIAMIAERQRVGLKKYGTTVEENPLPLVAWLHHALEETLDKAIYLQRAIEELEKIADDGK